MNKKLIGLCGALMAVSTGASAAPVSSPLEGITINGFVSFGYTYNFNTPNNDLNRLRVFDEDVNTFNIDVAELVIQKPVVNPGDAGFRIDLAAGGAIPEKTASVGLNLNGVGEVNLDLQQAYASYIAPIGSGWRWDFGKFITGMGQEVIEGYDGYNDHYSRSLGFNYAIPFTHTGVRSSYSFTDWLTVSGMAVNGWDQVEDVNNSKTLHGQVILKPLKSLTLVGNIISGPERALNNDQDRTVYEGIATWTPFEDWTFSGIYTAGEEESTTITARNESEWDAYAAYVKYAWSEKLSFAFRAERFEDKDGTQLGVGQGVNVTAYTFTPTYKFTDNFLVRLEGRWDESNRNVFIEDNGTAVDNQTTVAANTIFTF